MQMETEMRMDTEMGFPKVEITGFTVLRLLNSAEQVVVATLNFPFTKSRIVYFQQDSCLNFFFIPDTLLIREAIPQTSIINT